MDLVLRHASWPCNNASGEQCASGGFDSREVRTPLGQRVGIVRAANSESDTSSHAVSTAAALNPCVSVYLDSEPEPFSFDPSTVPKPPMQHFSQDIPRLFLEWHKSDLLKINGQGIALKHWSSIYKSPGIKKHGKEDVQTAWSEIRMEWLNWKV